MRIDGHYVFQERAFLQTLSLHRLSLLSQHSDRSINVFCFCLLLDCLSRLGLTPLFLSAVGKDEHSESILHYCQHMVRCTVVALEKHGGDDTT